MVKDLTLDQWRSVDPEGEMASVVFESLEDEVENTPNWASFGKLPLYTMFLDDLIARLSEEVGIDFAHEEERDIKRSAQKAYTRH